MQHYLSAWPPVVHLSYYYLKKNESIKNEDENRNLFRPEFIPEDIFFFFQIITIRNKTMYIHLYDDASGKMVEWRPSIKKQKLKRNKDGWAKLSSTKCLFHVQMVSLSIREIRPSPPTSSSLTCHPITILASTNSTLKKRPKSFCFFFPGYPVIRLYLLFIVVIVFLPLSY